METIICEHCQQSVSRRTRFRHRAAAGHKPRRYPFNESFFDSWSSELAWLLGLIWSDGSLSRNNVEICSKDRDILETVAALIGQDDGVRSKNAGRAWRIVFASPKVATFLRSLGLTEAKSKTANWPAIPSDLKADFVRGLLDGDGSAYLRHARSGQQVADLTVAFCGAAPDLRDGLSAWLRSHEIPIYEGISQPGLWRISIHRHDGLRRLHALLYGHEPTSYLARKRRNWEQWLDQPRAKVGRPRKVPAVL